MTSGQCQKCYFQQKAPPMARAAYFHSLRVHLQIMTWKRISVKFDPTQWGWKADGKFLQPIMTDLDPAPGTLLKFIRCKCKVSTRNPCSSNVCSCQKHGLKCIVACGDCHGQNYQNTELFWNTQSVQMKFQNMCNDYFELKL